MEEPPPVPPKDVASTANMEGDRPSTALTSGSKRKRQIEDDLPYDAGNSDSEFVDADEHTPKRRHRRQSDVSASDDDTPAHARLVRRKKGSRNLSNLNLRHAANAQPPSHSPARSSRFQEGSLTDKPSEKPPSVFTRLERTQSGNVQQVDTLMGDYDDGMSMPNNSAEVPSDSSEFVDAESGLVAAAEDEAGGFFQFGRKLAATFRPNFRPIALWKAMWNQSEAELIRERIEEEERKANIKAEAEARYASMKQSGQLELQPIRNLPPGIRISSDDISTPRDSAVAFDSLQSSIEQDRSASAASGLMPLEDDPTDLSGVEVLGSSNKLVKGLKDRLHLKKPSLTNMKSDLKRMSSNISLSGHRESSSSLSPVKTDVDNSTLRHSVSKFDLKKQQKLSKRVSDLEGKLLQARRDLDEALVEASPAPKLTGKYERFTPSGTIKKAKFQPGKLPSLPSERVLMAEQMAMAEKMAVSEDGDETSEPRKAMDLTEFLNERDDGEYEETIKASRARQYPTRASSLFNVNSDLENQTPPDHNQDQINLVSDSKQDPTEGIQSMDPNSINKMTGDEAAESAKPVDYASLDAKLKALDANVKTARRASKLKKRKSAVTDEDKSFKPPGVDSDDEAEWQEATPKKKRKSSGKTETSPPNRRASRAASTGNKSSPVSKKGKASEPVQTNTKSVPAATKDREQSEVEQAPEEGSHVQDEYSADELADEQVSHRNSIDSQSMPLDPVYEEEEETSTIPLKDAPSKPTAKATPARYGRSGTRSRSSSPQKRAGSVQQGIEEQIISRAAHAAQRHPGRQGSRSRSVSPPPPNGYSKTKVASETVSVVPGQDGVPKLPKGANGSFESLNQVEQESSEVEVVSTASKKDDFEWPEDLEVF